MPSCPSEPIRPLGIKKHSRRAKTEAKPRIEVTEREILIPKYITLPQKKKSEKRTQKDPDGYYTRRVDIQKHCTLPIVEERIINKPKITKNYTEIEVTPEEYIKHVIPSIQYGELGALHAGLGSLKDLGTGYELQQISYRHEPKPVEIEIQHYKSHVCERWVDRVVPIPVELEVILEYKVPLLVPNYITKPIPIPVSCEIDVPMPLDVMMQSNLRKIYEDVIRYGFIEPDAERLAKLPIQNLDVQRLLHLGKKKHLGLQQKEVIMLDEKERTHLESLCTDTSRSFNMPATYMGSTHRVFSDLNMDNPGDGAAELERMQRLFDRQSGSSLRRSFLQSQSIQVHPNVAELANTQNRRSVTFQTSNSA